MSHFPDDGQSFPAFPAALIEYVSVFFISQKNGYQGPDGN